MSFYKFFQKLFTLKASPLHITCFDQYGPLQMFRIVVHWNCCFIVMGHSFFCIVCLVIMGYTRALTDYIPYNESMKTDAEHFPMTTTLNVWWWLYWLKCVVWCGEAVKLKKFWEVLQKDVLHITQLHQWQFQISDMQQCCRIILSLL